MSWNHVVIEGDLLCGPELRLSAVGSPVATFRVNAGQPSAHSRFEDVACWVEVVCFGALAEHVAASLAQGDRVVVTGRLSRRSWQSDEGGGSKVSVRASDVAASLRRVTAALVAAPSASADQSECLSDR
jgi:single-strand DNA-binding protein